MTHDSPTRGSPSAAILRVFFRLHFYAGLIVAPFVLILAVSGAIYLFVTEIEDVAHPDWRFVQAQGPQLAPERLVDGALTAHPDARPTRVDLPTAPDRTAVVFMQSAEGAPFRVYVDPVSGRALGDFVYEDTLIGWADRIHGTLLMGDNGDLIVELASCWAIVMVLTGLFLWWPRSASGLAGVLVPRFTSKRIFLRDLHAVGGVWVSLGLLFLLLTGLPWATNWGGNLNRAMAAAGIGYPAAYRTHISSDAFAHHEAPTLSHDTLAQTNPGIPWTLETAPAPLSDAGHDMAPISVAKAARIFAGEGLTEAYRLIYPRDAQDVFTAYTYPDRPEGQRTIHLDQYSGAVINDVDFEDYGVGAQIVEWGVQLHMGNYFGLANQIVMLLVALGAAVLSITGPLMWLLRRKSGLGAPKTISTPAALWTAAAFLALLGVIFPALGATALLLLLVERFVLSRIPPIRDWLGLAA
jgi:uncharacterized iron-regulated membrane protein